MEDRGRGGGGGGGGGRLNDALAVFFFCCHGYLALGGFLWAVLHLTERRVPVSFFVAVGTKRRASTADTLKQKAQWLGGGRGHEGGRGWKLT